MFTITADELPRFMACNGSRKMFRSVPPSPEGDQTSRDEGTAAHWLIAAVASGKHTIEEMIDRKAPNGVYISEDMAEHVQSHLDFIRGFSTPEIELDTSFGDGVNYQVNARADCVAFDVGDVLYVADFKYGWRIVEPQMHWTLIAHAIGWCAKTQRIPREIRFIIHQPRPHHRDGKLRSWTIGLGELYELQAQLIQALMQPSDVLNTGPQCDDCPALATCPAARNASYNAIDVADTVLNEEVGNEELMFHIDQLRRANSLLKARLDASEELAIHRLRNGAKYDNYSVEQTLTNRQWKEGVNVELLKVLTGVNLAAKSKMISPAQAEKKISKEIVAGLCERIPTGFKLVRVSAAAKARKIFGDPATIGVKDK